MTRLRPAIVRFYIDADLLGLGKLLGRLRPDVTYPGDPGITRFKRERPACPITDVATLDDVWIPTAAKHGWLAITRDSAIQGRRSEINAVRENGARLVSLAGKEAKGTWDQLEIVMCQWRAIEALLGKPGPFIYTATRTSLTPVEISP
ncbi:MULTISPECIES: PIN-like domain-containing protein [unclassified Frankia]